MHSINNLSGNKIKEIKKLHLKKYRDEKCLYIAEGEKAFEEAVAENIEILEIYALKTYKVKYKENKTVYVSENDMKKISTTASACEVLIIAKQKDTSEKALKGEKLILIDSISDPGNLGTIIRSASAFGADGIILYSDCVELYSPKVIRSCAGNFYKTPIIKIKTSEELKEMFPNHTLISTALKKDNTITINEIRKLDKLVIMFGSEANGLSKKLIETADKNILLNMKNNVDSLNIAVCASIILYEMFNIC